MSEMIRQEHLDWCKKRALEYCDKGDVQDAFASMASDWFYPDFTDTQLRAG